MKVLALLSGLFAKVVLCYELNDRSNEIDETLMKNEAAKMVMGCHEEVVGKDDGEMCEMHNSIRLLAELYKKCPGVDAENLYIVDTQNFFHNTKDLYQKKNIRFLTTLYTHLLSSVLECGDQSEKSTEEFTDQFHAYFDLSNEVAALLKSHKHPVLKGMHSILYILTRMCGIDLPKRKKNMFYVLKHFEYSLTHIRNLIRTGKINKGRGTVLGSRKFTQKKRELLAMGAEQPGSSNIKGYTTSLNDIRI